jgi:hypothetical protein
MCMTCGCMDAHKEMGEQNITYEDLAAAATENGKSVDETFNTMIATRDRDRADHENEWAPSFNGAAAR